MKVVIVGGGLAGCEAAWQCLMAGMDVVMFEMKPLVFSPAHKLNGLAELVCSNSLKSNEFGSAAEELKFEMKALGSIVLKAAEETAVPAGKALAVDRKKFSKYITEFLTSQDRFKLITKEVIDIPSPEDMQKEDECWVIATGPLSTDGIISSLSKYIDKKQLYFYDAIAPIIASDSIDFNYCFFADRYSDAIGDYLNIPLEKDEYYQFINAVINADKTPLHEFESTPFYESCMPIEVMIERGKDTLRFGPMKPVGIINPKTQNRPYANIQLRAENQEKTMFSMVGFQTKMTRPSQKKVFSILPALKNAEFYSYGSIHRNTYFNSPKILSDNLSLKSIPRLFLAGQITGVEGYMESAAMGLLCGMFISKKISFPPPKLTIIGALLNYITTPKKHFTPINANLGLLPFEFKMKIDKKTKKKQQCEAARKEFNNWVKTIYIY